MLSGGEAFLKRFFVWGVQKIFKNELVSFFVKNKIKIFKFFTKNYKKLLTSTSNAPQHYPKDVKTHFNQNPTKF
jgi:hypothetical protein